MNVIAVIVCTVLVLIAALHFYWAVGGSAGKAGAVPSSGGKPTMAPGPASTALVAVALLAAAALVGAEGGLLVLPVPHSLLTAGCALLAAIFIARAVGEFRYLGFFKRVKDSTFARRDTFIYSPLCLALGVLIGAVALG
jgi:hypothetical protein